MNEYECMSKPVQAPKTIGFFAELLRNCGVLADVTDNEETPLDEVAAFLDAPVEFATCDSRDVRANTLFVCKGAAFKREYLEAAVQAGACAYVSETRYDGIRAVALRVTDVRAAMGTIADAAWDHPSADMAVCAFTGTKGKTTSAFYLHGILSEASKVAGTPRPALLTGICFDDGVEQGSSKLTTPEPFDLQRHLANARAAGAPVFVMEASSQALKYGRMRGVAVAVGAFTNIGIDHISPIEHPTFEDYFASKLALFDLAHTAVVNLDIEEPYRTSILNAARAACERVITYSCDARAHAEADVALTHATRCDGGVQVKVCTPQGNVCAHIPTPAMFNVANAVSAIACASALDIPANVMSRGLSDVTVPGRMETCATADGRVVTIVDYAHNGMSLTALLENVRESYPDRELRVLFGATGNKGVERRADMGDAAGALADRVIVTEDDPGTEDPADIASEIVEHLEAQGLHQHEMILDREQAIRHAIFSAERPCVVAVAGKGHECTMKRAGHDDPWPTDSAVVRAAIADYDAMHAVQ
ncbi:Mur ligase family protein [Adlercreutzia sp. ZJ141]|uniref:Mur ligase family protein n=1 Tax=Adlercreutzia sp. ZJ141 TaxID=2709406 RepID=UPI0019808058|nr:UDP-N-acetylmuramoyl-L-alanyl-D-glutamate--2,6-diaminopimelate ligase [Adlercreutzia sp. ZJ141]